MSLQEIECRPHETEARYHSAETKPIKMGKGSRGSSTSIGSINSIIVFAFANCSPFRAIAERCARRRENIRSAHGGSEPTFTTFQDAIMNGLLNAVAGRRARRAGKSRDLVEPLSTSALCRYHPKDHANHS